MSWTTFFIILAATGFILGFILVWTIPDQDEDLFE